MCSNRDSPSRAQDAELMRKLTALAYTGRTLSWDAEFEKRVATLTPDQIKTSDVSPYIDPAKMTIVGRRTKLRKGGDTSRDNEIARNLIHRRSGRRSGEL